MIQTRLKIGQQIEKKKKLMNIFLVLSVEWDNKIKREDTKGIQWRW
jgi:hypothetical protein